MYIIFNANGGRVFLSFIMAKEKNWSVLFPGIKKSVMACKFPEGTTAEEKERVFNMLVRVLLDKSVCKPDGSIYRWRSGCLDYLMDILPRLEEEEIRLVLIDKNSFYKRFCFSPSKKMNSLYSELKRRGGTHDNLFVSNMYERYHAELGLSPYELPEQDGVAAEFLSSMMDEEENLFSD